MPYRVKLRRTNEEESCNLQAPLSDDSRRSESTTTTTTTSSRMSKASLLHRRVAASGRAYTRATTYKRSSRERERAVRSHAFYTLALYAHARYQRDPASVRAENTEGELDRARERIHIRVGTRGTMPVTSFMSRNRRRRRSY